MRAVLGPAALLVAACADATVPKSEALPMSGPRDGAVDLALAFDGVDDYASAGTARMPQIERPQSLMLWVKPSGGGAQQVLLTLRRSDWSGIVLALEGDAPVAFNVFGPRDLARSDQALTPEQWYHLAFVSDGIVSQLYVDGAVVASGSKPGTNRTPLLAFIGSLDGYESMFHGSLDELRVYDRAFTPQEVAAVAAGQRPEADPPLLYLPFDEVEGARSYDRSALGNHALLGDGAVELMPARVPSGALHQ